jgi:hypothetical protein
MPFKKILAAIGQNGNGSIDYTLNPMIEKPKAKILASIDSFKAKILAGEVFVDTPKGEIPEYDPVLSDVKAKILAKILAGPPVFLNVPKGEIKEYDSLSDDAKAKILAKILAEIKSETDRIVEEHLPDSYEEDIRAPLKVENERLRRIVGNLYVENYNLKKKYGLILKPYPL